MVIQGVRRSRLEWADEVEDLRELERECERAMGIGVGVVEGLRVMGVWEQELKEGRHEARGVLVNEGASGEGARLLREVVEEGRRGYEIRVWLQAMGWRMSEGARWVVEEELRKRMGHVEQKCEGAGWRREVREQVMEVMSEIGRWWSSVGEKNGAIVPMGTMTRGGGVMRRSEEAPRWLRERLVRYEEAMRRVRERREGVLERNMGLVYGIARQYRGRVDGLELEDLVQEGSLALMKGIEKFEVGRGYRFSTYATWWVRQAMARAAGEMRGVMRAPVHVMESWQALKRARRGMQAELGREATHEELEQKLGWREGRVVELEGWMRGGLGWGGVETEGEEGESVEVGSMGSLALGVERSGSGVCAEWELTWGVGPMGQMGMGYEEMRAEEDKSKVVMKLLGRLEEQEREVMMLRFGIGVSRALTLEEVGDRFGVTRERVRQIEMGALEVLRSDGAKHLLRKWGQEG